MEAAPRVPFEPLSESGPELPAAPAAAARPAAAPPMAPSPSLEDFDSLPMEAMPSLPLEGPDAAVASLLLGSAATSPSIQSTPNTPTKSPAAGARAARGATASPSHVATSGASVGASTTA